jgi:hypothetical protein
LLPSNIETQELVVPRSIPIILPIKNAPLISLLALSWAPTLRSQSPAFRPEPHLL